MSNNNDPLYDEKKAFFDAKKERKIVSFSALAVKKADEAKAAMKKSDDMFSCIPFGQPILVGHHSENSDRNFRNKAWNLIGKSIELNNIAEHYAHKADLAENGSAISSDDPDAIAKLEAKLAKMKLDHDAIKKRPHKGWELSNSSQNMRSVKKRIDYLKSLDKIPDMNLENNGIKLVVDKIENRVKLFFPGKPSPDVISKLKSNGFKWSHYGKCWQRMLNSWSISLAKEFLEVSS